MKTNQLQSGQQQKKLQHKVLLTNQEKKDWFLQRINERIKTDPFKSQEEAVEFVRLCRDSFRNTFGRDTTGHFIRYILKEIGIDIKACYLLHIGPENEAKMHTARDFTSILESYLDSLS